MYSRRDCRWASRAPPSQLKAGSNYIRVLRVLVQLSLKHSRRPSALPSCMPFLTVNVVGHRNNLPTACCGLTPAGNSAQRTTAHMLAPPASGTEEENQNGKREKTYGLR